MYESLVGWRFLYRGRSSRGVHIALAISLAVALVGGVLTFAMGQPSPIGVLILFVGSLGAICATVLSLFSVFATVSVIGVVLGVAALTVVLSVTSGFQAAFRDKVLGVNAHVIVMKSMSDFGNYRDVEDIARKVPTVSAV